MNTGAWRIAVLFTASALGGTYITGDELLRFFSYFGSWGTIGLLLTTICLTWFGYTVMKYSVKNGIASLPALITSLIGPKTGPSLSLFLYLILLSYTGVIIGKQAEQISGGQGILMIVAVLLPCCFAFWLVIQGWRQMERFGSAILFLSLLMVGFLFTEQRHIPMPSFSYQLNGLWFWYALFYLALHFLLVLTILIPLSAQIGNLRTIRLGMGIGGLLYSVFVFLGHLIILAFWHEVHSSSQPLLQIVNSLLPMSSILFYLISLGHLIICLACLIYGLTVPLTEKFQLQIVPMLIVMFGSGLLLSFFPMVSDIYAYMICVAATYSGMALLLLFLWKHRY